MHCINKTSKYRKGTFTKACQIKMKTKLKNKLIAIIIIFIHELNMILNKRTYELFTAYFRSKFTHHSA